MAAIVVTFNRADVLEHGVGALLAQTRPPDAVYVVDNASTDETRQRFEVRSDVVYLRAPDNGGYASGLALGIATARRSGHDMFWLLDDDSAPLPLALASLLDVVDRSGASLGLIGLQGGLLRYGNIKHLSAAMAQAECDEIVAGAREVEFSLVDGALLLDPAALLAGSPDRRWFMMFEDIDLSWRIRRAGFKVAVLEHEPIERGHLGSSATGPKNPWRRYYLVRNQFRWAIETRDVRFLIGTTLRFVKFTVSDVRRQHWSSPVATAAGLRDALLNRMGRTVPPGEFHSFNQN
ncbi:hypothetical protein N802_01165 [Knoellia sinensis KCTC 19936]|uniref:Uncharacterized protein n=1 Tax=Knoellia sinensis KCTC 19936 TaxID=1385520 RepID=A0A0A0JHB9_9MICO|nr:glycosyltransferase [Knoellia sinensis]KGN35011.1 hypothetical protein N802_01165 [Knoellia sinensis KCTC 19936]